LKAGKLESIKLEMQLKAGKLESIKLEMAVESWKTETMSNMKCYSKLESRNPKHLEIHCS